MWNTLLTDKKGDFLDLRMGFILMGFIAYWSSNKILFCSVLLQGGPCVPMWNTLLTDKKGNFLDLRMGSDSLRRRGI